MKKTFVIQETEEDMEEVCVSPSPADSDNPLLSGFKPLSQERQEEGLRMEEGLRDKFRGCLTGALVGDCIGSLFEGEYGVSYSSLVDLYTSLTNLSEDEKQMDLHGIDFSLEPKMAMQLLDKRRASVAPFGEKNNEPLPLFRFKRHSSSFEKDRLRRASFSRPIEKYSNDTVMTRSVARSLLRMKGFDARDMAIQLTEDYFLNLTRKYGGLQREIFAQLRNNGYTDPYAPSKKVSTNIGSMGNDGATRVAPVVLYWWNSDPSVVAENVSKLTKITNYHKSAVVGATFQSLAIHSAFNWEITTKGNGQSTSLRERIRNKLNQSPQSKRKFTKHENIPMKPENEDEPKLRHKEFCKQILDGITKMESKTSALLGNIKNLVTSSSGSSDTGEAAYIAKIQTMLEFLERPELPTRAEVVEKLGNGRKALDSVPTALYAFLLAATNAKLTEMPVHITSPVLRTIFYAISLGGDSDTTASMAGAIAGAFWGYSDIPQEILRVCEGAPEMIKLADELLNQSCRRSVR